jgi:regulator of nucleoside diphosphate kinase
VDQFPIIVACQEYERLKALISSEVTEAYSHPNVLRQLTRELEHARMVDRSELPDDVIAMDSLVTLRDEWTAALMTYRLVYPERADIASSRLSVLSPIGAKLFGRRRGEVIGCSALGGSRLFRIEEVSRRPATTALSHV